MATVARDLVSRAGVKGTILTSTVANGTAPLVVTSTTAVSNLNADLLDGNHASVFGVVAGNLGQFASTTSSQLAGVISDETGSDKLVFNTSPTFITSILTSSESFDLLNSTATTINFGGAATNLNIGNASGTVTIAGNLTVNGTTTTVNSTTVTVDDKNLELGSTNSPTDITADGGGISLLGTTTKTFNWVDATDSWTSSEHLDLASGKVFKINGTTVLSSSTATVATVDSTNAAVSSKTVTVTANSTPTTLDSFAVATYRSAKYLVQMVQNTKVTTTEILVLWDGTDVQITEYGILDASAGAANATITAAESGGTLTVSISSSDAASTNVVCKASVTYIKA